MLAPLERSSPVLVMISSRSVPICNHFHVIRANSGKKPLFSGEISFSRSRAQASLNLGVRTSRLLKFTFNAKNFIRMLSWSISSHFGAIHF